MLSIAIAAFLAGVDNLQACGTIGLLPLSPETRRRYAFMFSVAEFGAPFLGMALGGLAFTTVLRGAESYAPVIALGCGLAMLVLALLHGDVARHMGRPGVMVLLPASLSVDNLIAGVGLRALNMPMTAALVVGVTGAVMSCIGLYLANGVRLRVPRRMELVAGLYLCILSVRMLMAS